MPSHYRAKKRDDHLPPIDLHDLGPKRQKLIRKILSSCDGRRGFEGPGGLEQPRRHRTPAAVPRDQAGRGRAAGHGDRPA